MMLVNERIDMMLHKASSAHREVYKILEESMPGDKVNISWECLDDILAEVGKSWGVVHDETEELKGLLRLAEDEIGALKEEYEHETNKLLHRIYDLEAELKRAKILLDFNSSYKGACP